MVAQCSDAWNDESEVLLSSTKHREWNASEAAQPYAGSVNALRERGLWKGAVVLPVRPLWSGGKSTAPVAPARQSH